MSRTDPLNLNFLKTNPHVASAAVPAADAAIGMAMFAALLARLSGAGGGGGEGGGPGGGGDGLGGRGDGRGGEGGGTGGRGENGGGGMVHPLENSTTTKLSASETPGGHEIPPFATLGQFVTVRSFINPT